MIRTAIVIASLGFLAACDESMMSSSAPPSQDAALGTPASGEFDAANTAVNPLCDTSAEDENLPAGSLAANEDTLSPGLCDND